jgi:hypothetical protein
MLDDPMIEPADVAPLLDEHHLVVLGEGDDRDAFAERLHDHLAGTVAESSVTVLEGKRVRDLGSFCRMLDGAIGSGEIIEQTVDGVVERLRGCSTGVRHHYFIWHDADTLLEHDVPLFGRLVNAMLGVAAEREHLSPDVLVIQRHIFLGNYKLGAYADDDHGQFRSWLVKDDVTRFWDVASCLERPPVLMYRLGG